MDSDDDEALYDFVSSRYPNLRRSAYLMCGDWTLAEEHAQAALARLVTEMQRGTVEDRDAQVYADMMAGYQHRPARREHVFVAPSESTDPESTDPESTDPESTDPESTDPESDDPAQTILVLDALHKLSPRCRAVVVLRHWDGFAVDETADMLGLPDTRVEAYEAAGLAAVEELLATGEAATFR